MKNSLLNIVFNALFSSKNQSEFEDYIKKRMNESEENKESRETVDIDVKYLDVVPPIHVVKSMDERGQFNLLLGLMNQRENEDDK